MSYKIDIDFFSDDYNISEKSKLSIHNIKNLFINNKYKINVYFVKIIFFIIIIVIIILINFYPLLLKKLNIYYLKFIKEITQIENYFQLCNNGTLENRKIFKKIKNPKISIISPIYNREKYILRFIRSIQNQFFDDIEIILVDDSSIDNSVKLIKKYQIEDERIVLIKHKKNKGTLISRNHGILLSKGEYLIIPDPDDILSNDILNICYNNSKNNNYDMMRFNIFNKNENTIFFNYIVEKLESKPIYQPQLFSYLFYGLGYLHQIDYNLSNKFIKREAYIRALNSMNNFYLNQYMTNLEDGIMNYVLYKTAKSFYFIKKIGYYYLQNNQSITIKPIINYDQKIRFIFIHLKLVFETTKNNKFEKNMTNLLFKGLYILFKDEFNFITKDFIFYLDIIEMYLDCEFIDNDNKLILIKLKLIIYKKIINKEN